MLFVPALRRAVCAATLLSIAAISAAPVSLAQSKKEPSYYAAQPATENVDLNMYAAIRAEGLGHSHVMEYMSGLSDGIGPRLTGSPNMKKANEWTRDRLSDAGMVNAHLEDWGEFGMGWAQVNSWARMITPDTEPIWIQAAPWSPATKGAVTGEAALVELSTEADLQKFKGKLGGKIVLLGAPHAMVDLAEPLFSRYTEAELKEMEGPQERRRGAAGAPNVQQLLADRARLTALRSAALKMMTEEGVAAILSPSRDGGKGGGSGIIFDDNGANLVRGAQTRSTAVAIPNAVTTVEMYGRMYRLLKANSPVRLEVNIETTFTGDHEHGFNTVAEITGNDSKLKNEVVMVGGHLDSWISGTGATDNGAGSVVAMEAMRILKSIGYKPKRTLRIALWSGEEQGLFGSRGYVKQHFGEFAMPPGVTGEAAIMAALGMGGARGPLKTTKEWETLDAYYNLDNGSGRVRGVYTQENYAVTPIFAQWIAPLKDLGVTTITTRNTGGTDHLSYDAVGLPGFQFIQDELDYETRTHHSNLDTVEHIKEDDLKQAAVVEAIFLYNTSEREAMMPRKAFPHPEQNKDRDAPLKNLFPTANPAPDAGKPNAQ